MRNLLRTLEEKSNPSHTALIVVDMQNDICSNHGSFARMGVDISRMAAVAPAVAELAAIAKQAGVLTIYTQVTDKEMICISDAYYEVNLAFYERYQGEQEEDDGTAIWVSEGWGEDFFHPVKPAPEDPILVKHRFGAFTNTKLDQILRSNHIKTVVLTGVLTDVCVESTARAAIDQDYYVVIVGDCTATVTEERQRAPLAIMANIIGTVTTFEEVANIWRNTTQSGYSPVSDALFREKGK